MMVMVVMRCALDVMMVVHRLYRATMGQTRLSSAYGVRGSRSYAFVMVVVMVVMTESKSISRKVLGRRVKSLLVMLRMMVMMTRRVSVLATFDTSHACRCPSAIVAIIVKDVALVLDSFSLPTLLRANSPHHFTVLWAVVAIMWQWASA
jgi:hypothetical protein